MWSNRFYLQTTKIDSKQRFPKLEPFNTYRVYMGVTYKMYYLITAKYMPKCQKITCKQQ